MDSTSWSQTWSTKSTTTKSRRPLRRRRKLWRWKRMYLLLQADHRLKQNHEDLPLLAHLQELYPFVKEFGLIFEPGTQSNLAYPVAKRLNTLRHGQLPREEDGDDWILVIKGLSSERFCELSTLVWRYVEEQDGRRRRQQEKFLIFVLIRQDKKFFYLRVLHGHSGRNPIDPTLQDNVLIPDNFFEYIHHIGSAISLHSLTNSGLTAGGQNSSRERRYSLLLWIPWTRIRKIRISLTWPNHVLHRTSRSGKDIRIRCIGSKDSLLNEKDWSSLKQDVMQSSFTIHSQLIVFRKLLWWNLEKSYTKKFLFAGSSKDTQRIQPKPKKQLSKSVRPAGGQESINEILFDHEDIKHSTRTERPVGGLECTQSCASMPIKIEEEDQTRTVRPCKSGGARHSLTSEYQDWHMQLWKKQDISEFKSLSKRSKVIFIEKHFKPTCSRITSTTHSATIRRRWCSNRQGSTKRIPHGLECVEEML